MDWRDSILAGKFHGGPIFPWVAEHFKQKSSPPGFPPANLKRFSEERSYYRFRIRVECERTVINDLSSHVPVSFLLIELDSTKARRKLIYLEK